MVKVSRKEKKSRVTKALVSWLQRSEHSPEDQLKAVAESQKSLLQALRGMIGEARMLEYELRNGHRVRMRPFEKMGFTLEFVQSVAPGKNGKRDTELLSTDLTARELYDLYFPDPAPNESELEYHVRLLEGLDLLTDELAMGRPCSKTFQ